MTSDFFFPWKMTVLPEYSCCHPPKDRSQNRMPWTKEWFNTCGHSFRFLDRSPLQSFCLDLSLSSVSLLSPSTLLIVFFPHLHEEKSKNFFFLLYYLNIRWECGRTFCSNQSTILLPACHLANWIIS